MRSSIVLSQWPNLGGIIHPIIAFAASRLAVFISAVLGNLMLPANPGHWEPVPGNWLLSFWARWDSRWYDWIVSDGYWLRPGQRSNIAFFPMYPLSIKSIMPLTGDNAVLAGILISNASFLVTLFILYQLVCLEYGRQSTGKRAVYYLAFFPTSFFFSMMYTESLFLLFATATAYFARRHLWVWAALMGLLASTTRIVGVLLWGFVMWEWLRVHGWTVGKIHLVNSWHNLWLGLRRDWVNLLIINLIPLGLLSYMVFLQVYFKDPVAFSTVQAAWGRETEGPIAVVTADLSALMAEGATKGNVNRVLNLTALFSVSMISLVAWKQLGAGYSLYTLLAVLIPASSGSQSIIRYALICFPIFMVMANWGRIALFDRIWSALSAVLLGVMTIIVVNWFFLA